MIATFFPLGFVTDSVAQAITISPEGAVTNVEGNTLTVNCTDGTTEGVAALVLRENNNSMIAAIIPSEVKGAVRSYYLPVDRTRNGNIYDCQSLVTTVVSQVMTLTVICK